MRHACDVCSSTCVQMWLSLPFHSLEHPESGIDSDIEPPGVLDWITTLLLFESEIITPRVHAQ